MHPRKKARSQLEPLHVAAVLVTLVVLTMLDWKAGKERRALDRLPEPARKALFNRTLESVEAVCFSPQRYHFSDYCRSEASFLKKFPECDTDCRTRVRAL